MPIVAEVYEFVVGVDTHAKVHQYAIVQASTGQVLEEAAFPASGAGMARAAGWLERRCLLPGGDLGSVLISAEGTGSYGSRLASLLLDIGYRVIDAPSPKRDRGQDKNDSIDAIKAARAVLGKEVDRLADVRTGEAQECVKVLLAARNRMCGESTRATNALNALLRGVDLGVDARRKVTITQVRAVAQWRTRSESPAVSIARAEAVRLATRIVSLRAEIKANEVQLRRVVTAHAPVLLDMVGVGPVNAAIILSVWSHPGRIHTEAALAKLGGVSPIQIASGDNSEHRLNRGGDRQLNRALHSIANTRMRMDAETRSYVERRTRQGMSKRRVRRCLKRYIARQIYRTLAATAAAAAAESTPTSTLQAA